MVIQKKIGYKEPLMIEDKSINQLLHEIMFGNDKRRDQPQTGIRNEFKKWIMPEEPKGFLKYKEHDPL